MVAEQVVRAFWPLWTVVFVAIAPVLFGWHEVASLELFIGFAALVAVAFVVALIWGLRKFRWPERHAAVARVDAALPGRPIAAVADAQAIGAGDPGSETIWNTHVERMAERTKSARAVEPNLQVSDRDPYGVRFIALLFFLCALLFGSLLRLGAVPDVIAGGETLATGPVWEGWVAPPSYTGKPTLYLSDIPEGNLRVPQGSTVTLRLYGEVGALTVVESVTGRVDASGTETEQRFDVTQSGELRIEGENGAVWSVVMVEDAAPMVELVGPVEVDGLGEMSQPFRGIDDYGVSAGKATFALDLDAVTRRYGIVTEPEPFEALVLDLPMPFNGERDDFEELLIDDLSEHPLANLPVTLTLEVTDDLGQIGRSEPEQMILPGRRFFQPFAKAIIEQRRDLMWSKENGTRVVQVLKAIGHRPEGLFSNEVTFLRMRAITRNLDGYVQGGLTDVQREEIVQAMWDLAIQLEDGTLADARARMERAQERLSEAMRNGASDEEIAELMQELREAHDDYMQMLAELQDPSEPSTDQPDTSGESFEVTQSELDALLDRIQELMEEGRMAEAEALMEQYNELMENLQITQNQAQGQGGPQTPGQQSMQDLEETLRDQEELSDEAFRELQEQTNPGQQGQEGQQQEGQQQGQQGQQGQQQGQQGQQQGQDGQDGQQGQAESFGQEGQSGQQSDNGQGGEGSGSLSDRQSALRQELERQRGNLPGLRGEAGDIARRSLDRAEGAMEGAEEALRDGDLAEAIDRQAEAMDALRDGMRSLGEALAEGERQPGEGTEQGEASGQAQPTQRDPLGRQFGNSGQAGTEQNLLQGEDIYRRADELLGEIRRRSADQERPEVERNYLRRLLDRF